MRLKTRGGIGLVGLFCLLTHGLISGIINSSDAHETPHKSKEEKPK